MLFGDVAELNVKDFLFMVFSSIFRTIINIKNESVQLLRASQDSSQSSLRVFPANMVQSHEHESLAVSNTCHFIPDTCRLITNTCYLSMRRETAVWRKNDL